MGTVYKKTATKPLPAGAKIIVRKRERFAEWTDAKQKRRTAPVIVGKDGTGPVGEKCQEALIGLPATAGGGRKGSEHFSGR